MGKRRDKKAVKRVRAYKIILILISALFAGCHTVKSTANLKTTVYSGSFTLFECTSREKKTGTWKAIEINGKVKEVKLYTKFGIPIAELKIKGGKIFYNKESYENPMWEELVNELPLIARGKVKHIKKYDVEITAENGNIIVLSPYGWGKIKIKSIRRLP